MYVAIIVFEGRLKFLDQSPHLQISKEHSLSFYPRFSKFESNSTPYWLNPLLHKYLFFTNNRQLLKTVGKEEIACNKQFLLYPMFSIHLENCTSFVHIFDIILVFVAELEEPKTGILGKGLSIWHNQSDAEFLSNASR